MKEHDQAVKEAREGGEAKRLKEALSEIHEALRGMGMNGPRFTKMHSEARRGYTGDSYGISVCKMINAEAMANLFKAVHLIEAAADGGMTAEEGRAENERENHEEPTDERERELPLKLLKSIVAGWEIASDGGGYASLDAAAQDAVASGFGRCTTCGQPDEPDEQCPECGKGYDYAADDLAADAARGR